MLSWLEHHVKVIYSITAKNFKVNLNTLKCLMRVRLVEKSVVVRLPDDVYCKF